MDEYFEAHSSSKVLTSDRTLQRLQTPRLDQVGTGFQSAVHNKPQTYLHCGKSLKVVKSLKMLVFFSSEYCNYVQQHFSVVCWVRSSFPITFTKVSVSVLRLHNKCGQQGSDFTELMFSMCNRRKRGFNLTLIEYSVFCRVV